MADIYEYSQDEIEHSWFDWSCGLWWNDFKEAEINKCFIAWEDDQAVGFQTIDRDGLCVAIEVKPEFQGQSIASQLIEESGCWKPRKNENPDFWESIKSKFGW